MAWSLHRRNVQQNWRDAWKRLERHWTQFSAIDFKRTAKQNLDVPYVVWIYVIDLLPLLFSSSSFFFFFFFFFFFTNFCDFLFAFLQIFSEKGFFYKRIDTFQKGGQIIHNLLFQGDTFIVVIFVNCYVVFHFLMFLFEQLCKLIIYSVTFG